jgi:GNAT superfamily N-acetyltransferase
VSTVVAAFSADPAWSYLLGPDYPLLAPMFAGALFDQRVDGGTVWLLPDAASVAMWDPPGGPDPARRASSWARFHEAADPGAKARLAAYDAAVDAVRPTTDFWYLGVLATRPDSAGRGGATRVLAPGLARADADGLDSCLETSTTTNRAFYSHRGFTDAVDVQVPGGPPTWWLRRPSHTG